MSKINFADPGTLCLIQQTKEGRIRQIGLTSYQSDILQSLLGILSSERPLVQMGEEHDLVLKSTLCKNCKKKLP